MTPTRFVMSRENNLSTLTVVEGEFNPSLKAMIENQLTYTHVSQVRGETSYGKGYSTRFESEEVVLYAYNAQRSLVFPRGFSIRVFNLCKDSGADITVQDMPYEHVNPDRYVVDFAKVFDHMDLRAKQDECLATIASSEGGQISAPTGFGKSFTFAAICLMYPKARIHVITKRRDVMKRLLRHLSAYIPNVGQVGAGVKNWERITVITADSMHLVDHCPTKAADLVLYDEVHEAAAASYAVELAKYKSARMFGFSATPDGRFDGAHHRLEGLFGPKIFEMTYQEAVKHELVLPVKVEWIDVRMDSNPCSNKKDVAKERWGVWRNTWRNEQIANKAKEFGEDVQVLILVKTLEHAVFLKQALPDFKLCYDKMDSDVYAGLVKKNMLDKFDEPVMTPSGRDRMAREFESGSLKKVIATDVWSTGVDFPQLAVLIRADARASQIMNIQAPGRVVRKHDESGKEYGLVVDCMDYFDDGLLSRSLSRSKAYTAQGWQTAPKRVRGSL